VLLLVLLVLVTRATRQVSLWMRLIRACEPCLSVCFQFKTNDATENNTHCEYIPDVYPPTCVVFFFSLCGRTLLVHGGH
jgi:hypothetical protein